MDYMKRKVMLLVTIVLVVLVVIYTFPSNQTKDVIVNESKNIKPMSYTGISMMYETDEGSGEYIQSDEPSWLGDEYVFNSELSNCENGGTLAWDDTNKTVKLSTNKSDKCYVYFDVKPVILLANYVKGEYISQGTNGLYFHDNTLENAAEDNSYRYAGANPNNYVCFGSDAEECPEENLYRIIGVFDNSVKLIKYKFAKTEQLGTNGAYDAPASSTGPTVPPESLPPELLEAETAEKNLYYWGDGSNGTNRWNNSLLSTENLNGNSETSFINSFSKTWQDKINEITWQIGGVPLDEYGVIGISKTAYSYEMGANKTSETYNAKIGLMYVSDFGYATTPENWSINLNKYTETAKNNNWLFLNITGISEWTISRCSTEENTAFYVVYVGAIGLSGIKSVAGFVVRPCFYLIPDVKYKSGNGTIEKPYRIEV